MKSISELRDERIQRGLSQSAVAEAMGTTQSALSRAEREGNPTQTFLSRYADALDSLRPDGHDGTGGADSADSILEIATIRLIVPAIAKRHGVADMYAYGSVARGDARSDSDVDLLYRMQPDAPRTMTAIQSLRDDLERALGRPVSLTSYDSMLRDAETSRAGRRFLDHIRPDLVRVA